MKSSAKESNALCLFKNCDWHNQLYMKVLSFPDGLTVDIKREVSATRSPSSHPLSDREVPDVAENRKIWCLGPPAPA